MSASVRNRAEAAGAPMPRRRIADAAACSAQRSRLESREHSLDSDANLLCRVRGMAIVAVGIARGWISRSKSGTAANMPTLRRQIYRAGHGHEALLTQFIMSVITLAGRPRSTIAACVSGMAENGLDLVASRLRGDSACDYSGTSEPIACCSVEGVAILREGIRWHRKSN